MTPQLFRHIKFNDFRKRYYKILAVRGSHFGTPVWWQESRGNGGNVQFRKMLLGLSSFVTRGGKIL
jgi:hypothetical protein